MGDVSLPTFLQYISKQSKLTTEENEQNSEKCGVQFLGENTKEKRITKKSTGGRNFERNEYLWTVLLKLEVGYCSGVQISPRHILTAAHCIVDIINDDFQPEGPDSVVSTMKEPEELTVYIGEKERNSSDTTHCLHSKNAYKVAKITAHNFELSPVQRDIALVELSVNISEEVSTPICMPNEELSLHNVLFATGSGRDSTVPVTLDRSSNNCPVQRVVAQKYASVNETKHEIETITFARSTCEGDSGGPVFQVDEDGRHILVGLTSWGPECTKHTNTNMYSYNVDVRAYVDWVCKYSGVCPIEERKDR